MEFEKSENPLVRRRKNLIAIFSKRNRTATIISGTAILLVLCTVAIQYSAAKRKSDVFQAAIADIDSDLLFRRYPAAQEQIGELLPLARNKRETLGLLKRGFRIAKSTDSFHWFDTLAQETLGRFPKERDLLYIASYSSMRDGNIERAVELMRTEERRSSAPRDDGLSLLQAEAALRLGNRSLLPAYREGHLLSLLDSDDPAALEKLGRKEGNRQLLVDAALLYLSEGDIEKALIIARDQRSDTDHDVFYASVNYDSGEFEEAAGRLKRYLVSHKESSELILFLADIQLLSGAIGQAQRNYRLVLNDQNSDLQSQALLNYAWILGSEGKRGPALSLLRHGYKRFGWDTRIGMELAKAYADADETAAIKILRSLIEHNPEDLDLRLLLFRLDSGSSPSSATNRPDPKSYRLDLWRIFTANPTDERLCRFLTWYLIGLSDDRGAQLALSTYQRAGGDQNRPWFQHTQGLAKALGGDYKQALACIDNSLALAEDSGVLYNRAVMQIQTLNLKAAEDDLWRALDRSRFGSDKGWMEGVIRSRIGEVLLLKGNRRAAVRELRYAMELDPSNFRTLMLLEELNSR